MLRIDGPRRKREEEDEDCEMENIQLTNDYFNRIKVLEFSAFFYGWLGIGCSIIYYEFQYHDQTPPLGKGSSLSDETYKRHFVLLFINFACTLLLSNTPVYDYSHLDCV